MSPKDGFTLVDIRARFPAKLGVLATATTLRDRIRAAPAFARLEDQTLIYEKDNPSFAIACFLSDLQFFMQKGRHGVTRQQFFPFN